MNQENGWVINMGWRTVVVNTHSKLSYRNNHLIFKSSMKIEMIHLSEIDIILLETTDITLTTMLVKRLMDENILVIFCDDKRLPKARLESYSGRHDSSLQLGKQLIWNPDIKMKTWTSIIHQKIINQGLFLERIGARTKAESIFRLATELEPLDPSNREGHAARIYFGTLFGKTFTRKKDSEINGALDYGYSLVMSMFARELVVAGCMTQFGLKHANQFNEYNLASDIMEPFRPVVDEVVYEYQTESFETIKRALLNIFNEPIQYGKNQVYLTNIVSDYTKKVVRVLNCECDTIPEFCL